VAIFSRPMTRAGETLQDGNVRRKHQNEGLGTRGKEGGGEGRNGNARAAACLCRGVLELRRGFFSSVPY